MALLLRLDKASPLTNQEMDDNLVYLDDRCDGFALGKLAITDLLLKIKEIDGIGSGIDADLLQNLIPSDQNLFNSIVARDSLGNFSAAIITANLNGNATSATIAMGLGITLPLWQGGTGVNDIQSGYVSSNGTQLFSQTTIPAADIVGNIPGNAVNVTGIVPILNGGTGETTISGIKTVLGLVPGQTIQSYNSNLQNLSGLSTDGFIIRAGLLVSTRIIEVGAGLNIVNGNAVSGNPVISISQVSISKGGTGAPDAPTALFNLGAAASNDSNLTGIPTAPTAAQGTKTNQIATTDFVSQNSMPTGATVNYAGPVAPIGYLEAAGGNVSRSLYPELFALININFGFGDGSTTFTLPNMPAPAGFITIIKT